MNRFLKLLKIDIMHLKIFTTVYYACTKENEIFISTKFLDFIDIYPNRM